MSQGEPFALLPRPRPRRRLSAYAPWPLMGIAIVLVVLIVLTPVLFSTSHQPTPGILTQAEMVVDKISTNASMHFYVWALGEEIRYSSIDIAVASDFNWSGNTSLAFDRLNWTQWYNDSDVLSVLVETAADPVALNVTVHYVSPSGSAWYVLRVGFFVTTGPPQSLYSNTDTSGIAVASPIAVSNSTLPFPILLHNAGSGGTP